MTPNTVTVVATLAATHRDDHATRSRRDPAPNPYPGTTQERPDHSLPPRRGIAVIDTSRIRYYLPILGPAQVVHYVQPDDLDFIQQWISYLRDHDRVAPTVRTTVLGISDTGPPAASRLVVTIHNGHSERGEILRIGQSLILHERQLTVLDTETLHQRFHVLRDPLADERYPPTPPAQPATDTRQSLPT